jgi:hypothetical protein
MQGLGGCIVTQTLLSCAGPGEQGRAAESGPQGLGEQANRWVKEAGAWLQAELQHRVAGPRRAGWLQSMGACHTIGTPHQF